MPKKPKPKFGDFFKEGKVDPKYKGVISEESAKRGEVGVFAPHSGNIDKYTKQIVDYVAKKAPQSSKYTFASKDPKHHTTSTRMTISHSNQFSEIAGHVKKAIAVHGYKGEKIYVGGDDNESRNRVGEKLQASPLGEHYEIIYDPNKIPKHLRGTSKDKSNPYNFINKIADKGGVQVELPHTLRENKEHRKIVGDTLAEVVNELSQGQQQPLDFQKAKAEQDKKLKYQQEYKKAA
jgi:phage replication-related protein YjqB (UPF0714/DUF867 family)|tara:strand:+ start:273 stop:977 length:705 start_codon:yes stop_codon:yes gene_type:complete